MFWKIAGFEFRYQMRQPVFWVGVGLIGLLAYGLMCSPNVSLTGTGGFHKNAPWAIGLSCLGFTTWYMLVTTAFVANVVIRDDQTGFGPIVRSTPASKFDYLMGRFTGAFGAAAIGFLCVPVGMFVGTLMPWIDAQTLGPNDLGVYAYGYFALALPSVLLTAALFFTVATVTRSMMWTYVAVIAFMVLNTVLGVTLARKPELETFAAYVEPFGTGAYQYVTKYWTMTERNTGVPSFEGVLLYNRLIVIGVSLLLLALGYSLFRAGTRGAKLKKAQKLQQLAAAAASLPARSAPLPKPVFDGALRSAQFWKRTRFEMAQVFKSPAYSILLLIGLLLSYLVLFVTGDLYGAHPYPTTRNMTEALAFGPMSVMAYVIAAYYAGELVWRERERNVHEIVGASALPDWAFILPKMLALALVMVSIVVIGMVGGLVLQTVRGFPEYEIGRYLLWYVLPTSIDYVLIAVLAIFLAVISPHKFVGWGLMVVFLIASIVESNLGFNDHLYDYASGPPVPLSEMNGVGHFWIGAAWFKAYWAAFAVILATLSYTLWRRGVETRIAPQFRALPHRLKGAPGLLAGFALITFAALGVWIYTNTHVWNLYLSNRDREDRQALYERLIYDKFYDKDHPVGPAHPSIVATKLDVDLYPHQPRMVVRGSYVLENRTGQPLSDIHVHMDPNPVVQSWTIDLPGATRVNLPADYEMLKFRIYHLATPMQPGQRLTMNFTTVLGSRGFGNDGLNTHIVDNGTFINNFDFAPILPDRRDYLLSDPVKRRAHGLPSELRPPKLTDDPQVRAHNYIFDADWQTSDITIHTDADQTPLAPGEKVSDVTAGGRRTARFVNAKPVLGFFAVLSARYAEKRVPYKGVDLVVYYDPHHAYNVDRMIHALKVGLDYYQPNFHPFQFSQARIAEFPALVRGQSFAQSFPNIFPWEENLGFAADVRNPDKIDYVTYVAAHEFGHQWWGYQVVGADMQGDTMLSETMAQYSALMTMEKLYGPTKIRQFLKYELDSYLRARGTEELEELPLDKVESNQGYIHYRKGAVAMYLLRDQLGEQAVDNALKKLIDEHGFRGAPYPASTDLVALFKAEAPPDKQQLIEDLFEYITLWDIRTSDVKVKKRADGKYDVTVTVEAKKFRADGKGKETNEPMKAEPFDLGLFAKKPGAHGFGPADVILFKTVPLSTGTQRFNFIVDRAPTWGGADPYNKYIVRDSNNNLAVASD